jgi:hypothetical protein
MFPKLGHLALPHQGGGGLGELGVGIQMERDELRE